MTENEPAPPDAGHRLCFERARRTLALAGWQLEPEPWRPDRPPREPGHQLDGTYAQPR